MKRNYYNSFSISWN